MYNKKLKSFFIIQTISIPVIKPTYQPTKNKITGTYLRLPYLLPVAKIVF